MQGSLDIYIFLTAIFSFFVFLILHIAVLLWLMRVYYLGGVFDLFLAWFLLGAPNIFFIIFSLILYTMLVFCYVLGIFGLMESSIRIGLLVQIAKSKNNRMKKNKILKIYNSKVIIAKRLERFVASGELKYEKGYYFLNKKFSYFIINNFINSFMRKIYGKKE